MKKGVMGKALTFIISLILGLLALALLVFFLSKTTIIINDSVEKIILGIKCKVFCEGFLGSLTRLVGQQMCVGC